MENKKTNTTRVFKVFRKSNPLFLPILMWQALALVWITNGDIEDAIAVGFGIGIIPTIIIIYIITKIVDVFNKEYHLKIIQQVLELLFVLLLILLSFILVVFNLPFL